MKYIYIVLFIIFTEALFAQKYVLGKDKILNYWSQDYLTCKLHILDSQYCIVLSVLSGDIIRTMFVSYGYIRKEKNLYYLKDIPTNAEIILEKNNHSNFNIKKGFSFMQNEKFFYEGKVNKLAFSRVDIEAENIKKKKKLQLINNEQPSLEVIIKLGRYKNGNIHLVLEQDNVYKVLYMFEEYSCLISEGKWLKKGNLLKLNDPFLNDSFKVLIESDEKLISIDFPDELNTDMRYSLVDELN